MNSANTSSGKKRELLKLLATLLLLATYLG